MSDLLWRQGDAILSAFGRDIGVSCVVRNEVNNWRWPHEVVFSTQADGSRGVPYYPRAFPVGLWRVTTISKEIDPYMAPWFIATDAHQLVEEWEIAERDRLVYVRATGRMVEDYAYGLHCSTSPTTLGCLRIDLEHECRRLVDNINRIIVELDRGVTLEVTA